MFRGFFLGKTGRSAELLFWLPALIFLVTPALLNGFPLAFPDTGPYISPLSAHRPNWPPFYSFFTGLTSSVASLLALPLAQAVLVLFSLHSAFRVMFRSLSIRAQALASALTIACTQLPWLASWIMPDVFFGIGSLSVFSFVFAREESPSPRFLVAALVVFCSAIFSTANTLIYLMLLFCCLALRCFYLGWQTPRYMFVSVFALCLSCIAAPISYNVATFGPMRLNVAGNAYLFARLADHGLAQLYLQSHCPAPRTMNDGNGTSGDVTKEELHFRSICRKLKEIPAIPGSLTFLWSPAAFLTNALIDPDGTFGRLDAGIARAYPASVARLVASDIFELATHTTLTYDQELNPSLGGGNVRDTLEALYPQFLPLYEASLQNQSRLMVIFPARLYGAVAFLSYVMMLLLLGLAFIENDKNTFAYCLAVIAAVVLSHLVHAGLVGPYPRYHVKASWLVTFFLFGILVSKLTTRQGARAPHTPRRIPTS